MFKRQQRTLTNARTIGQVLVVLLLFSNVTLVGAVPQEPENLDNSAILRLEAGGPKSPVMSIAFGPDGDSIYEAGWDKVVRVWVRDQDAGRFRLNESATYRIPIGPRSEGVINAIALSKDGRWLAAAGSALIRGGAGFRRDGLMIPSASLSPLMLQDRGTIFVFDTRSRPRIVKQLRGHRGPVFKLAFAEHGANEVPILASLGRAQDRGDDQGELRLWNVESGEELATEAINSLNPNSPLSLDAWGSDRVRVAIADDSGAIRFWDPQGEPNELRRIADGANNNGVAWINDRGRLLSGSYDTENRRGRVRSWFLDRSGVPQVDRQFLLPNRSGGEFVYYIPRAIAPIASQPGGPTDHAAVLVVRDTGEGRSDWKYYMLLLDLNSGRGNLATIKSRIPLGPYTVPEPRLVASPDGRRLALSIDQSRTLAVLESDDLLDGDRKITPDRLRGRGQQIGEVAFVRRGESLGLRLREEAPTNLGGLPGRVQAGDLVVDASSRSLDDDPDRWTLDAPDWDGWDFRAEPGRVELSLGRGSRLVIEPEPGAVISSAAFRPALPPFEVPVVALATVREGEPTLGLYDGRSGKRFRQLTGHVQRITSLSFSGDGRLLGSAAEDQTVRLWSLIDAPETLGELSQLPGSVITTRDDGVLIVATAGPDPEIDLREGDVIQGIIEEGELLVLDSLFDFYDRISLNRPGETVLLRRSRRGVDDLDVEIRLEQAVDERKPLLSFFLTDATTIEERDWIAWNPLGPYDSSGPDVERLLGWHFNTGDPNAPTRFAEADQFVQRFRRENLIEQALVAAEIDHNVASRLTPRPENILISFDVPEEADRSGEISLVREVPGAISVTLLGDELEPEWFDRLTLRVDGGPSIPLDPNGALSWRSEIEGLDWKRGRHQIEAEIATTDRTPQQFSETRWIRYQPPAPQIAIKPSTSTLEVNQPKFNFAAMVQPTVGPVQARLVYQNDLQQNPETREWASDQTISIREIFRLVEGRNIFELHATNVEALQGFEAIETRGPLRLVVNYHPDKTPPSVRLESVARLTDTKEPASSSPIGSSEIVVDAPRIVINGTIEAEGPIDQVEWSAGHGWKRINVEPGHRPVPFQFEVDAEPGPTTIRVRAKSPTSDFSEGQATVVYRPRVPKVVNFETDSLEEVLIGPPDRPQGSVQVKGQLVVPPDHQPFEAEILVNGRSVVPLPELVDAKDFLTEVPLDRGENRIQIRLWNQWGSVWSTEPKRLWYRQPPRIEQITYSDFDEEPLTDVSAIVSSSPELPVTDALVRVEGTSPDDVHLISTPEFEALGNGTWKIQAKRVPLFEGPNTVTLLAWNADGLSPDPGIVENLIYRRPLPPKPTITINNPSNDGQVLSLDRLNIEFEVRSDDPLETLMLSRGWDGSTPELITIEAIPSSGPQNDPERTLYRTLDPIPLELGTNAFQFVAVTTRGAQTTEELVVSYVPPPVRVVVERILPKRGQGEGIEPVQGSDNRIQFPDHLQTGQVELIGKVIWGSEATFQRDASSRVRVWVNQFPQAFAELTEFPTEELTRSFRADLILNQEANEISIDLLPEVPIDGNDRDEFVVYSDDPESRQRLHLLIVGVNQSDRQALLNRALEALHANPRAMDPDNPVRFQTPAFLDGRVYGPYNDDVSAQALATPIGDIHEAITSTPRNSERPIEVVLIYFQGDAWIKDGAPQLGLSRGQSVNLVGLADRFAETGGIQLFMIDATREVEELESTTLIAPSAPPERWPPSRHIHHVGILNYNWWNLGENRIPPSLDREDSLFGAFRQALVRKKTMVGVASYLQELFRDERFQNTTFNQYVPESLNELKIGILDEDN